jgi:NAD-dependent dihydropyrimidine dehydrogenase PreA subunit
MVKETQSQHDKKNDKAETLSEQKRDDAGRNSGSDNGRNKKPGGLVEIAADLCKGCLLCTEACPPDVLTVSERLNKMGYHPVEYICSGCTGCGICYYICPEPGAITVYKRGKVDPRDVPDPEKAN